MLEVTGAHVCPVMTNLLAASHTMVATEALLSVKVTRKRRITHTNIIASLPDIYFKKF